MRLLAWNIRQGGGSRLIGIVAAITRHDADVLILSEYRGGESAGRLRTAVKASGYRYITKLVPPPQRTGVLIASRRRFVEHGPVCAHIEEPWRLVDVDLGIVRLTGVYMPNLLKKVPYWQTLVDTFAVRAAGDALAIGDFNTCRAYVDERGALDTTAGFMDRMAAIGFCCGGTAIPTAENIPGIATEVTVFVSIMRSCRRAWLRVQASSAIRMWSGLRVCRIIRCCSSICHVCEEGLCHEVRSALLQYRPLH